MSKKDYIQSISEIKAADDFKRRLILKMRTEADTQAKPEGFSTYKPEAARGKPVIGKLSIGKLSIICGASLILMLSTLVYAGVLDFNKIYETVFGVNYETVQPYIEPIYEAVENDTQGDIEAADDGNGIPNNINNGAESIYDGIIIRGVSAINDENTLRIFATAADTTQDRLSENAKFDNWGLDQGYGGNISVVDFDGETKTATLLITSLGEHQAGKATLYINGFVSDRKFNSGVSENGLNLYEELKNHSPETIPQENVWVNGGAFQSNAGESLAEQSGLLKPDELNIAFDNIDWCSVSNIGFVDGRLHIQTKSLSDNENDLASINFVNSQNEVIYDGHLFLSFTNLENRSNDNQTAYEQYKEMIFEGITNVEQLKDLFLTIDYMEQGDTISGNWEISFNIPEKATIEINTVNEAVINGKSAKVDSISISPLGVTVRLPENIASEYGHNDAAYVIYEDGSVIDLTQTAIHGYESESALVFSGETIEIERVQSIVINEMPVDFIPVSAVFK